MEERIINKIKRKKGLNYYDKKILDVVINNPKITNKELAVYKVKRSKGSKQMSLNNEYIAQKYIDWVKHCLRKI